MVLMLFMVWSCLWSGLVVYGLDVVIVYGLVYGLVIYGLVVYGLVLVVVYGLVVYGLVGNLPCQE